MAKNNSLFKIEGTLDNVTFYKSTDGYLVRTKGGVSKNRIMNDPAFVRTRENGMEFGRSASSGKLLRSALGTMVFKAKDSKLSSRLMKVMSEIKNEDLVSDRGYRSVGEGIQNTSGKLKLKGFDFNKNALMQSVLYCPYVLDALNGEITLTDFISAEQLRFPQGATHFSMQAGIAVVDFTTELTDVVYTPSFNSVLDFQSVSFTLVPNELPTGTGTKIYVLLIEFFQEVNGVQYSLKNGAYNVLNVLEVD